MYVRKQLLDCTRFFHFKMAFPRKKKTGKKWSRKARSGYKKKYSKKGKTSFFAASRWVTFANYQLTAGNAIGFYSQNFKLSDLDDYTSYTSLFDQYKIKKITVQFRLLTNPDAPLIENTR